MIKWIKRNLNNLTNYKEHFVMSIFPSIGLSASAVLLYIITKNHFSMYIALCLWIGILLGWEVNQYHHDIKFWWDCKVIDTILDIAFGGILMIVLSVVWSLFF